MTVQSNAPRQIGYLDTLRVAVMVVLPLGAAGSFTAMLRAGGRNPSFVLLVLFTGWVLAPFLALAWANLISKSWGPPVRKALFFVALLVTLGSLAVYGVVAFGPPVAKPAAPFLMTPLVSWLLLAVVPIAARRSR